MLRHRLAVAAAVLLALARGAAACSSFLVDCGDGAVVTGRTLDFSSDLVSYTSACARWQGGGARWWRAPLHVDGCTPFPGPHTDLTLFPKSQPFEGLPSHEGAKKPTWNFNYTFVAATVGATLEGMDGEPGALRAGCQPTRPLPQRRTCARARQAADTTPYAAIPPQALLSRGTA